MSSQPTTTMRVAAAVAGNAFDWYDFSIYAYMTPIISSLFFPVDPHDPATQINAVLATTAVFGVGFFMRPVGGVVLGVIGDKYGRRTGMVVGLALMALATLIMTFAPTYADGRPARPGHHRGVAAAAGLLGGRAVRHLDLVPHRDGPARQERHLRIVAVDRAGRLAGGRHRVRRLPHPVLHPGRTSPPACGGCPSPSAWSIVPLTWYIRRYLDETQAFQALKKQRAIDPGESIAMGLVSHTRHLLVSIGMIAASAVSFYAVYGYTVTYAKTVLHLPVNERLRRRAGRRLPDAGDHSHGRRGCATASTEPRKQMLVAFLAIYFLLMYPAYAWLAGRPHHSQAVDRAARHQRHQRPVPRRLLHHHVGAVPGPHPLHRACRSPTTSRC